MSNYDPKGYFSQAFDGGGTTSGMTPEQLRERDEYLRELARREGVSYSRQGMGEWLGQVGGRALSAVGNAVNNRVEQFRQTPAGDLVMNRALPVVGQLMDQYEQGYMKPLAIASNAIRGALMGPPTGYGMSSGGRDSSMDERRRALAERTLSLVQGEPYEPGDVTGSGFVDTGLSMVADPANYIPGGAAITMPVRRASGIFANVVEPGLREFATRSPTERYLPPRKLPKRKDTIDRSNRMTAIMENLMSDFDNPESPIRQRFDSMVQRGIEREGATWYHGDEIQRFVANALNLEKDHEEVRYFMNMFYLLNAAVSPRTPVVTQLDRAMSLLQRMYSGQKWDDIVQEIADNPGGRTMFEETLLGSTFGAAESAVRTGRLDHQKTGSFVGNYLGNLDAITIDTHNLRQFLWGMGMDYRTPEGRSAIIDFLEIPNKDKVMGMSPKQWNDELYKVVSSTERYSTIENIQKKIAETYGLTPADFQAVLWVGGTDVSEPKRLEPFAQLFVERMGEHAARLGISPQEVIRKVYNGELSIADFMRDDIAMYARRISAENFSEGRGEEDDEEEFQEMGSNFENVLSQDSY